MNDEGEYRDGFKIIRDILSEYPDVDEKTTTKMSPDNINNTFKVLIACFSQRGDILSQWRAYADDGKGFSIGFDLEMVKQHNMFNRYLEKMEPITSKIDFISVSYELSIFEKEVHQLIKSYKNSKSPIRFKLLARALMYMAIRYKDNFFTEEQEIRGFIAPEDAIKGDDFKIEVRECNYGKTHYHQLKTSFNDIHAIKEIIIGPKSKYNVDDIRSLLKCHGLSSVTVNVSNGTGKYR